jgi:hypothetical protein
LCVFAPSTLAIFSASLVALKGAAIKCIELGFCGQQLLSKKLYKRLNRPVATSVVEKV